MRVDSPKKDAARSTISNGGTEEAAPKSALAAGAAARGVVGAGHDAGVADAGPTVGESVVAELGAGRVNHCSICQSKQPLSDVVSLSFEAHHLRFYDSFLLFSSSSMILYNLL